jgi:hypothetical protein
MWLTWFLTVFSLMYRVWAISRLVRPSTMSSISSASRRDSRWSAGGAPGAGGGSAESRNVPTMPLSTPGDRYGWRRAVESTASTRSSAVNCPCTR